MTRNDIIQKIIDIVENFINNDDVNRRLIITEKTDLFKDGLEFSSIDAVMFIVNLEEKFGIFWPDELLSFENSMTIGEVADIVTKCLEQKRVQNEN